MDYSFLFIFGILGGILAGMLGVGGGVVYILILPYFLKKVGVLDNELVGFIIANSIFAIMFVSLAANFKNIIKNNFDYKIVSFIGFAGAISSIFAMKFIVQSEWYSKIVFSIVISFFMILMLIRLFSKTELKPKTNNSFFYVFIGIIAGLASSLSGLGGGVMIVPLLMYIFGKDLQFSKTISLGAIGIMAFSLTTNNLLVEVQSVVPYSKGFIVFPIALTLSIGVIIGTPIGVKVSKLISDKNLKLLFSLMLIIVIIKKFYEIAIELQWL